MNELLKSDDFDTDDKLAIIDIFLYEVLFEYDKEKCMNEIRYDTTFTQEELIKFYNYNNNMNLFDNFINIVDKELRLKFLTFVIYIQPHDEYLYRSFCMVILNSDVENDKKFNIIKYFDEQLLLILTYELMHL